MPNSAHRSLVNPFEPSSCAAACFGPKHLIPAVVRSSTRPATSGASGPTTTRSIELSAQKRMTAVWSATARGTHSATSAVPGRTVELGQQRAGTQLPGERVFAAAGADEEYVHRCASLESLCDDRET